VYLKLHSALSRVSDSSLSLRAKQRGFFAFKVNSQVKSRAKNLNNKLSAIKYLATVKRVVKQYEATQKASLSNLFFTWKTRAVQLSLSQSQAFPNASGLDQQLQD